MTDRIAEIEARHAAATAGEWAESGRHVYSPDANICAAGEPRASKYVGYTELEIGSPGAKEAYSNANFIAHAHQDIPYLIGALKRRNVEIANAERAVRELGAQVEALKAHNADLRDVLTETRKQRDEAAGHLDKILSMVAWIAALDNNKRPSEYDEAEAFLATIDQGEKS